MLLSNTATISRIGYMTPQQLKDFREKHNLSQGQLAAKLKVARNTVSRWEIGAIDIPEIVDLALKTVERELTENSNN